MKQTAVEWLHQWHSDNPYATHLQWRESLIQAKEMEKQQMIEFARAFWYYAYGADAPPVYNEDVEKLYNKTHGK
jgi:hypothetical protein